MMKPRFFAAAAAAALWLTTAAAHAQVFKCSKPGGGTVYTDEPCKGKVLDAQALNANQVQGGRVVAPGAAATQRPVAVPAASPAARAAPARAGFCPEPVDVKNIETAASSHEFNRRWEEHRFLMSQASTWRACDPSYSRLTPEIWTMLKETHADQTAHDAQIRYRARLRAAQLMGQL